MNQKKDKKKFADFDKSIISFIKDEDGFVTKDKILKIGLGTISGVAIATGFISDAHARHLETHWDGPPWMHTQHGNYTEGGYPLIKNATGTFNLTTHSNGLKFEDIIGTNCKRLVHNNAMASQPQNVTEAHGSIEMWNWDNDMKKYQI